MRPDFLKATQILLLSLATSGSFTLNAQEIIEWRGVGRTGYYPSTELLDQWPEKGPEVLMLKEGLPNSYSSVVVKDDIIYTTGTEGSDEILYALYADGSTKWKTRYGKSWDQSFPNARSTPTIQEDYAWVISGRGDISCISLFSGKIKWTLDAYQTFEGKWGKWGVAESPLIIDDKVIYTPGGDRTSMVALDKFSGEVVWESPSVKNQTAYTSPVLAQYGQDKVIITVLASYVICVSADDGALMWKYNYKEIDAPASGGDINPVTPLVKGKEVFVTSGYNHVGIMLSISDDLRSAELKWKTSELDVHHGGVIEKGGYLYGSNFTNIADGDWLCIDWDTGELQYAQNWKGKGSIIRSDEFLICYEERRGNIALVKPDPSGFHIISEFRVEYGRGPHWSHPAIFDNKLYIRHGDALVVYNIGR